MPDLNVKFIFMIGILSGLKRFKTQTIENTFLSAYVSDVIFFHTSFKIENIFNDY